MEASPRGVAPRCGATTDQEDTPRRRAEAASKERGQRRRLILLHLTHAIESLLGIREKLDPYRCAMAPTFVL